MNPSNPTHRLPLNPLAHSDYPLDAITPGNVLDLFNQGQFMSLARAYRAKFNAEMPTSFSDTNIVSIFFPEEKPTKDTLPFALTIQNCRDALQNVGKLMRAAEQDFNRQQAALPGLLEELKQEERQLISRRQQIEADYPEYTWKKNALSTLTNAAANPDKTMEDVERARQQYFAKIKDGEEKVKGKEEVHRRIAGILPKMTSLKDKLLEAERKVKKLKHEMTRIQKELDYRLSLIQPPTE